MTRKTTGGVNKRRMSALQYDHIWVKCPKMGKHVRVLFSVSAYLDLATRPSVRSRLCLTARAIPSFWRGQSALLCAVYALAYSCFCSLTASLCCNLNKSIGGFHAATEAHRCVVSHCELSHKDNTQHDLVHECVEIPQSAAQIRQILAPWRDFHAAECFLFFFR